MVGKKFAQYVILEKAGSGGMGVVYRARDETLQREVALKLPSPNFPLDQEARARLLREARAASALNHPHICTIYEVGEFQSQPYIAMEFVGGDPLGRIIPPGGLPTETVLDFGCQVADALECAHTKGILHRDLKSANVRMTPEGRLKVLDFGLALNIKETSIEGMTRSSNLDVERLAGTLAYIAPELLQGQAPEVRTDIWSLGVLLYEMAAGALPFQGRTGFELTTAILREQPPPLPTHIAPGLRAVILRCMSKRPELRYQHASEVQAAMEALQSNEGVTAQPVAANAQTRRSLRLALTASVILAIVLATAIAYRFKTTPQQNRTGGHLRLLLSTEEVLSGPALSPDGKMLAYVMDQQGRTELYVRRIAGGEPVRLTKEDSRKAEPQFSPDGETIVFTRWLPASTTSEICTVPALGGTIVPLLSGGEWPVWSPDGTRLAYIFRKQGEPERLVTSLLDGSDSRILMSADDNYPFLASPAWSANGSMLAVTRSQGGNFREIWIVPAVGGTPKRLTTDAAGVFSEDPVFSSDGLGVIHRSNRGGAPNLWWQPLDGGSPVQLTNGPGPDESPSVARDGTVAFLNSHSRDTLLLYSFATGQSTSLLNDASKLWAPSFSPDSKEIAYSRSEPEGSWHIWTIATAGGDPRQLTTGKEPEIYPRFAPDGATILFNTWGKPPLGIWRVPGDGGPARPVSKPGGGNDAYADPSPDGRAIVFARTEEKVSHLYLASGDGAAGAHLLLPAPGTVPRWSPGGDWIAFSPDRSFTSGIFLIHPDGTDLHRLTDSGGWPVWWPDGEQIGYQFVGSDGNTQIRVVSLKNGEARTLPGLHFFGSNYPFDVSRDDKWLVTSNEMHLSDEVWLLEPAKKL